MSDYTPHWTHRFFTIGVWIKGVDGILQVIAGAFLWSSNHRVLNHLGALFVRHELDHHSTGIIVRIIQHFSDHWSLSTRHFAAIYFLINGIINIGLVAGMLRKKTWSYPVSAALLSIFVLYQLHRAQRTHAMGLVWLSLVDILIVLVILLEYKRIVALSPAEKGPRSS